MTEMKENILRAMSRLIEIQGYHATGLNEIIKVSGAPKGSVYYYFPEGKEQIAVEAIRESGRFIAARLGNLLAREDRAIDAVFTFVLGMAENMESSGLLSGSPLTTASAEAGSTSEAIRQACLEAFDAILDTFVQKLSGEGMDDGTARDLSSYIVTVIEGGILMSRAYRDVKPLRDAAGFLRDSIEETLRKKSR